MANFHYRESPTLAQKKAFSSYLSEDEELILVTGFSSAYLRNKYAMFFLFPGVIFGGLGFGIVYLFNQNLAAGLIVGLIAMMVIAFLRTLHIYHANRYLLTTRRVIIKNGIFGVKLTAALYDKITHIEVDQGFIDRILLHHGSIIINTAGSGKDEIILKFVDYPIELKNLLERLINREREQFGFRGTTTVEGEILD